jgi:glycosyltransferase involved in cell wall biosynthesis
MLISVLIATFNRAHFLRQAVQSCLHQDSDGIDVVIVDDGSTDDTLSVLREFSDERVRVICCEHRGVSAARNYAIAEARGEFTLVLDSDDYLLPGSAEVLRGAVAAEPRVDIVYGDLQLVDATGQPTGERRYRDYQPDQLVPAMFRGCAIPHSGCLIRRSLFDRVGGYDEGLRAKVDYDFFARAVGVAACRHRDALVCAYRHHSQHLSGPLNDRNMGIEYEVVRRIVARYGFARIFPDLAAWMPAERAAAGAFRVASELVDRGAQGDPFGYAAAGLAALRRCRNRRTSRACADYLFAVRCREPVRYRDAARAAFAACPSVPILRHLVRAFTLRHREGVPEGTSNVA